MQSLQKRFIQFCLDHRVIRFGQFKLKSGRLSPYFFNAGLFQTGAALHSLGLFYAEKIMASDIPFDMLFGPAYKGIPLVTATAIALAYQYSRDFPYCFNRKEAKTHGEGGHLVGAELNGKVLILDDVMTAGTAVRQAIACIQSAPATLAGVIVLLDRQESGQDGMSATHETATAYNVPVKSIICFDDIIDYVHSDPDYFAHQQPILEYRRQYGISL